VYELNLSKCGLDDEDLFKICEVLKQDQGISSLKIGFNNFSNVFLLKSIMVAKRDSLKCLDISKFQI